MLELVQRGPGTLKLMSKRVYRNSNTEILHFAPKVGVYKY